MGQPKVASVTWRDRIRRISQGFYETMGQQIPQTRRSKPMRAWSHVKILNRDLRSTVIFLRKPKGISQTFRLRGRHCFLSGGKSLQLVHPVVEVRALSANLFQADARRNNRCVS